MVPGQRGGASPWFPGGPVFLCGGAVQPENRTPVQEVRMLSGEQGLGDAVLPEDPQTAESLPAPGSGPP